VSFTTIHSLNHFTLPTSQFGFDYISPQPQGLSAFRVCSLDKHTTNFIGAMVSSIPTKPDYCHHLSQCRPPSNDYDSPPPPTKRKCADEDDAAPSKKKAKKDVGAAKLPLKKCNGRTKAGKTCQLKKRVVLPDGVRWTCGRH
jgi:hypothetical protein